MKQSMNMGGSIASKNILEKHGRIKWCFREECVNAIDNGWRFLSEVDTDSYLKWIQMIIYKMLQIWLYVIGEHFLKLNPQLLLYLICLLEQI